MTIIVIIIMHKDSYHCNIIAIEKNLVKFGNSPAFCSWLRFDYILQQHVNKIVKA